MPKTHPITILFTRTSDEAAHGFAFGDIRVLGNRGEASWNGRPQSRMMIYQAFVDLVWILQSLSACDKGGFEFHGIGSDFRLLFHKQRKQIAVLHRNQLIAETSLGGLIDAMKHVESHFLDNPDNILPEDDSMLLDLNSSRATLHSLRA